METNTILNIITVVLSVIFSITSAYIIMRERLLKLEIKSEVLSKELEKTNAYVGKEISNIKEIHDELEEKIYNRFDNVEKILQEIMLKLERNSVR
jgi:hypothetical protein